MSHALPSVVADGALFLLVILLPILWLSFTDRFRRTPSPSQYATLFVIAAFAGILLFIPAISVVAATALLAIGLSRLSARYSLMGLRYQRSLSPARLFPGDEAKLEIRLDNRKLLPLAWLSITDPLH